MRCGWPCRDVGSENMQWPCPASAGYMALVVRDVATGMTIDSVLISGATETMMPGETKSLQFGIA